ncbi:vacuolar protein sorting-associated protein 37A isoform X2 [Rhinatrema bivittatum]|uniref:vacuolar protein sorting-associated protein 37A isoform X2 n=1 Tax=Rhinatrema bivittatum TaxID=194408 RepID=UPI0011270947|nr:vacuolar protein sorting-associated protein 37A isoform X2 [Rhinatrema bivittatum]
MNWFFPVSKSSGPLSPLTTLQQQKQRQIDSLKASHSSIAEIQKDVEYRLPFTINNLTVSINILLPPQFPQEKPIISVYPPIRHHIMDKQGEYVTCPLINNFTMHSDLGKIIQYVLDEFWKNPPVLVPGSASFPYLYSNPSGRPPYVSQGFPFLPSYPPQETNRSVSVAETVPPSTPNFTTAKPAAPSYGLITDLPLPVPVTEAHSQLSLNGFNYKMPDVPEVFPELSEFRFTCADEHIGPSFRGLLSVSQLSDMNEQEDVLLKQFVNLSQLKQVIIDKDDLVKNIEELAKKNLRLEPILETKRQAVLDKYQQLLYMKATFEKKMQRQHELGESCSASALQARLKVAAHEAEEESDAIAEDFLEGKVDIDDFLSSFMEKRMSCHCRRAKEEKLQQVMTMHSQYHAPL